MVFDAIPLRDRLRHCLRDYFKPKAVAKLLGSTRVYYLTLRYFVDYLISGVPF